MGSTSPAESPGAAAAAPATTKSAFSQLERSLAPLSGVSSSETPNLRRPQPKSSHPLSQSLTAPPPHDRGCFHDDDAALSLAPHTPTEAPDPHSSTCHAAEPSVESSSYKPNFKERVRAGKFDFLLEMTNGTYEAPWDKRDRLRREQEAREREEQRTARRREKERSREIKAMHRRAKDAVRLMEMVWMESKWRKMVGRFEERGMEVTPEMDLGIAWEEEESARVEETREVQEEMEKKREMGREELLAVMLGPEEVIRDAMSPQEAVCGS